MKRIVQTKQLPLSELSFYPANPRRGDVAAIRESLERTGQYRAIVVRSDTREVLAGCDVIVDRWQRHTGQTAVLHGTE